MATVSETSAANNMAELFIALGDMPAERVLASPPPGSATEADLMRLLDGTPKRLCELVDGVLVEKTMGFAESCLATWLISLVGDFVRQRNLGFLTSPDGPWRLWAGRVRMPDVAFISWDRLPGRRLPTSSLPDLVPNLVVEILSMGNTRKEMQQKREDYFSSGVELIWEIDPRQRTVTVYESLESPPRILEESDLLTGGVVLPDFTIALQELFSELDRQG